METPQACKGQGGYTFNEVLVAIALIGIGILGFSVSTTGVIQGNYASNNFTVATNLAQEKMEQLKAQAVSTNMTNCPDSGDKGLTAAGAPGGIYNRCWIIEDSALGTGLKRIDVTVSWRDYTDRTVVVSTLLFTQGVEPGPSTSLRFPDLVLQDFGTV
jgi:hypothetical protein